MNSPKVGAGVVLPLEGNRRRRSLAILHRQHANPKPVRVEGRDGVGKLR